MCAVAGVVVVVFALRPQAPTALPQPYRGPGDLWTPLSNVDVGTSLQCDTAVGLSNQQIAICVAKEHAQDSPTTLNGSLAGPLDLVAAGCQSGIAVFPFASPLDTSDMSPEREAAQYFEDHPNCPNGYKQRRALFAFGNVQIVSTDPRFDGIARTLLGGSPAEAIATPNPSPAPPRSSVQPEPTTTEPSFLETQAAAGPDAAQPGVGPGWPNAPDNVGELIRPSQLEFTAYMYFTDVTWTSWGPSKAVGKALDRSGDSRGELVTLTFTRPVNTVCGVFYSELTVVYDKPTKANGGEYTQPGVQPDCDGFPHFTNQ